MTEEGGFWIRSRHTSVALLFVTVFFSPWIMKRDISLSLECAFDVDLMNIYLLKETISTFVLALIPLYRCPGE